MFSRLRPRRPRHGTVVAYLALFVAMGGTAYAAATIGSAQVVDNSLESRDLKDNAGVRSQDVVNDTVAGGGLASGDIKNDSLTSRDVAGLTGADVTDNALSGNDINESSLGQVRSAQSASNAETLDGKNSTTFMPSSTYQRSQLFSGTANAADKAELACDSGDILLAGGPRLVSPGTTVVNNTPDTAPAQWEVVWQNDATADQIGVVILCADNP